MPQINANNGGLGSDLTKKAPGRTSRDLVSTYRFKGVVFFIVLVGPNGYLWQKLWYVGQGCNPLFVFHAVKHREKGRKNVFKAKC